ncbi:MAG: hypothetical protein ACO1N3_01040 [Gammaproteobacteria bacterium]
MSSSKDDKSLGPTLANIGTEAENLEKAATVVSKTKSEVEPYIAPISYVKVVARGGNPGPLAEKPQAAQIERPTTPNAVKGGTIFKQEIQEGRPTTAATAPVSPDAAAPEGEEQERTRSPGNR